MLEDIPDAAGVAEAVPGGALLGDVVPHQRLRLRRQDVPLAAAHLEDGHQLVQRVVLEQQKTVEAGLQTGVGVDELVHQVGVARHDDHQIVPVILHGLQQGVDGLLPEVVFTAAVEGIGLIHEQHAAHGLLDDLLGLEGGLPHIASHQTAAVHLHQLPLGENAQASVDAGHHPGHHGLAGAGIAGEHHVQRHIGGG